MAIPRLPNYSFLLFRACFAMILLPGISSTTCGQQGFTIEETTISEIHAAFHENRITSKQLVECYLDVIKRLNSTLHSVIEVNPDARMLAERADVERRSRGNSSGMQGIPVLLKDNIATKDKLNTTAGSLALLGSQVPRDAGVVEKLRNAGAIILGKASLSEWANFRGYNVPNGWNARSGQTKNAYNRSDDADPGGSSTGSAVSVAANMVTVSVGTETDGSIISPSSCNSVVGIKPTLGLTSRSGVVPITHRQDTVGPFGRSVSDAVYLLDAMVGRDERDNATQDGATFIPNGGYMQYLNASGLSGKRLGITSDRLGDYYDTSNPNELFKSQIFNKITRIIRNQTATIITNLTIPEYNASHVSLLEFRAMTYEFKQDLNRYLSDLLQTNIRTLAEVIAFNKKSENRDAERTETYGQEYFNEAENMNMTAEEHNSITKELHRVSMVGFEAFMMNNSLDAFVFPETFQSSILAIGGYPAIDVPAGYDLMGVPFGITFAGLKGCEPRLIEIAYGFEQAAKGTMYARRPPTFTDTAQRSEAGRPTI